jgi:hypothetical protein
MKQNMGNPDRIIRFIVVIAVIILLWTEVIKGTFATILGIIAIILVITSITGFCPIYVPFKISTSKKTDKEESK